MKIIFHKKFIKQQSRLSKKIQNQLDKRIVVFMENPYEDILNNHQLHPPFENCRSINISGNIRALYEQNGDTVLFVCIGTHSELYG